MMYVMTAQRRHYCLWTAVCLVLLLESRRLLMELVPIIATAGKVDATVMLPRCSPLKQDPSYQANYENVSMEEALHAHPQVNLGGTYKPGHCQPSSNLAIIAPFRDRQRHLPIFLNNLHALLFGQNHQYTVFVVHQRDDLKFNRGTLRNIGFLEARRLGSFDCFIFHDVDLIPRSGKLIYGCAAVPLHLCPFTFNPLAELKEAQNVAGAVIAMTEELFTAANGYSNQYWGWGAEDDDLSNRLEHLGYGILRGSNKELGTCQMLPHLAEERNPNRRELIAGWRIRADQDGLRDIQYALIGVKEHELYTEILVSLSPEANSTKYG